MPKAVKKTEIEKSLKNIIKMFDEVTNSRTSNRLAIEQLSKLAIIECCGWIEETHDELIIQCLKKRPNIPSAEIDTHYKNYVKSNYGFHYEKNFRPMLISLLGYKKTVFLEDKLDINGDLSTYKSRLGSLKMIRNDLSHTHTSSISGSLPSPQRIMIDYAWYYGFLNKLEVEIRKIT